ncbi:stAR-related lipid transfer protein 13 isoform X1 [Nannospalax galili]|uniref:stAR-related lipid transfer protein 13 isoform X1 n=1 Tax=Nannospalax galili TaxID=1026970 RepID=UPI0004ED41A4|nr:stAR-related lipid transfer protein 13 isoform X1 [Nannospalax galili]
MFSQVPRTPASGCYYLNSMTPEGQEMYLRFDQTTRRSPYRMSRILARHQLVTKIQQEIEAKEACDWLRAAGFPQYAQLYEDSQFPINIVAVKKDHDFLEKDLVEPLCRRLNTLNKCASMKLDVNFQRKKGDDSDEEDLCISNKWTFQRTSRRWSRVDDLHTLFPGGDRNGSPGGPRMRNTASSESVLTDLSEPEVCSIHSESSGGSDSRSQSGQHCADNTLLLEGTLGSSSLPQSPRDILSYSFHPKNEKPTRARAKSFLKRMETLRAKGAHGRHKGPGRTGGLVISGPVLQQEPDSFKAMQCIQIPNGDLQNSPPAACRKGPPCSSKSSGESSPSENSSRVSTPCMKERKCHHEANKREGMYLEDLDVLGGTAQRDTKDQNRTHGFHSQENLLVHIPKDHKPGTFPKALSIESLSPTDNSNGVNWRTGSISLGRQRGPGMREPRLVGSCHRASRVSIYDNVPDSHLYASTGDLLDLEDDLLPELDDILQHVNGIQEVVDDWSKHILPELQSPDALVGEPGLASFPSPNQITLDFEGNSVSEGRTTPSDVERDGTSLTESEATGVRERRDSGVGASLTRPNRRLRWNSFQRSHQPQPSPAAPHISNQTAGQLNLLQRFSLLRLTAVMEKYSLSNKHGWTWSVPKFMKRMKVPDYKDKAVFGVPLIVHVQRTGQPLPQSIQQALRYLRSNCLDQVGLFRKSGVKSRIHALRQMNENFPENVNYEDQSAYDVADMVKQFFRDLPEPLFTNKLSETFLHIYQYVPKEQRLQAIQAAILLLADENREALQTLLCFLNDVVNSVEENQMTAMNLAVCLAPSLFHLNLLKKESSPRVIQKKYATGKPDQKDLNENLAAAQGLAHMIMECNRLFEVPHEMVAQSRNSYAEAEIHAPTLEDLGAQLAESGATFHTYLDHLVQGLQKEAKEKFKGWVTCSSPDNTDLAFKKVGDGNPLKLWKASVEVEAPPSVVLNRVLRERHLWDEDFLQWKVVETLDRQTEVYQYVLNSMAPHPSRDFVVLRTWKTDLPKGMCTLVSLSVEHEEAQLMGGVRAVVMDSQYLIEPCGSGKSRLTHICRIDLKGHSPEWYSKGFGHLCAAEVARIRNSFQPLIAEGPETKI